MTIVVEDYDAALRFYVDVLGFDLAEDRSVGNRTGGRVGFFLRVDDFDVTDSRLQSAGVRFISAPA